MLILCVGMVTVPVLAASQNGLEVTFTTDKAEYGKGEKIEATLAVKNTNKAAVKNVSLENIAPDRYKVAKDSQGVKKLDSLGAGEEVKHSVTFVAKTDSADGGAGSGNGNSGSSQNHNNQNAFTVRTGDDNKIGFWLVIMIIAVFGITIFTVINKKHGKKLLSLFLCLTMVGAMIAGAAPMPVKAAENAAKTITVKKTVKIENKKVELNAIVKYSDAADPGNIDIQITNEGYDAENSSIITNEDKFTLTGTVSSTHTISKVEVSYNNYYNEELTANVSGTNFWSAPLSLEIGTNTVTILVTDVLGNTNSLVMVVSRSSDEITYSDNVKIADPEDYQTLSEEIVAFWNDDKGTEDGSDDETVLLVKDDALLLDQINNGLLESGNVYMIPENEIFLTGFVAVYQRHQEPTGIQEDYPLDEYPADGYEELIFTYPDFSDIFASDVSLDFSQGFDPENPVAFAVMSDGTPIDFTVESADEADNIADTADMLPMAYSMLDTRETIGDKVSYPRKGWQPEELLKNLLPSFKVSKDSYNRLNVGLNWKDVVLYDHDGIKNEVNAALVDYGQVKISGEVGIKNLKHTGGIEWHPSLVPWDLQLLPQQVISKTEYTLGGKVQLKSNATISTSNLVKTFNHDFENNAKFLGLQVSGAGYYDSRVALAVCGLNLVPPSVSVGNTLNGQKVVSKLSPSLVIVIGLDLDGKLTAEGSIAFGYSNSVCKGFNIQKNGYTGPYGSQNQNRSDKHYKVNGNYTLDVYDKNDSNFDFGLDGKIEASLDVGPDVSAGLMIGGLIPAVIGGSPLFSRTQGTLEGSLDILPEFALNGYAGLYQGIGCQADLVAKILAKCKIGSTGFDFSKHWEHMFWEKSLSTSKLDGTVYLSDDDGDNSNNAVLEGVKVHLKKNDTNAEWNTTTDSQGKYIFRSIPNGSYTITFSKDGFDTYKKTDLIFEKEGTFDAFLNEQIAGICRLRGKIVIADEDTDASNNQPLPGADIVISYVDGRRIASCQTASDGTYSLENLPAGNFIITISKTGYIAVTEAVSIAENIENYYNATIEAISEDFKGEGYAAGTVYDALTGRSVEGLTLNIRSGVGINSGSIVDTVRTDSNGNYKTSKIPAGNYSVEIVDERALNDENQRYATSLFNIKVLGDRTIANQDGYVTNSMHTGQVRFVLHWGATPRDLDSHLVGPAPDGSQFHTYYSNKTATYGGNRIADLDLDDTTSYGPETTTIYESEPGKYTFFIHDYTNRNSADSTALANSGAYVEVWFGSQNLRFDVPNQAGTLWEVCTYDSRTNSITPVNTITYHDDPFTVGSSAVTFALTSEAPLKDYEINE